MIYDKCTIMMLNCLTDPTAILLQGREGSVISVSQAVEMIHSALFWLLWF